MSFFGQVSRYRMIAGWVAALSGEYVLTIEGEVDRKFLSFISQVLNNQLNIQGNCFLPGPVVHIDDI